MYVYMYNYVHQLIYLETLYNWAMMLKEIGSLHKQHTVIFKKPFVHL